MSRLRFTKMQALGNDFMVVETITQAAVLTSPVITAFAERHTGVGFDQLIMISKTGRSDAHFRIDFFNADGLLAEQCGNGLRAAALFVYDKHFHTATDCIFHTASECFLTTRLDASLVSAQLSVPRCNQSSVVLDNRPALSVCDVWIGNPHCVLMAEQVAEHERVRIGTALQRAPAYPHGVNVGFLQVQDRTQVQLQVFERGVGFTEACGSGACAAVVAGITLGILDTRVSVAMPGGRVDVFWPECNKPVTLIGPAECVFDGEIFLPN